MASESSRRISEQESEVNIVWNPSVRCHGTPWDVPSAFNFLAGSSVSVLRSSDWVF